ncbi:FAD binding domain-containing protein [Pelobacter propionicus]|uniref:Molybdopterin dehydrogenase, FAD-binding protein n=1 Tax=Pelobacter propionicus (strain DSM 2379 / NBRC 103807 / OttBd1) TaxID=338966 RepID=A1AP57_PELPD|nr:xanthine dehydrogenase family protein subunit M [Pelobacter propionicus]ABK99127.1 molybdopterin dehydrogenase, FAD-binding protein [Pelobacter propionicus DSM 2379]
MRIVLSPSSLEELFSHLEHFPQAMVMAGGTDLLVRLRQEPVPNQRPLLLLAGLPELQGINDRGTEISIGAATPLARLISHPLALGHAELLVRAARTIGGPAIRNMATLGGNISTASPAGDSLPALQLLGAELELASRHGTRRLSVGDFVAGPGRTQVRHGEVITRILLPREEDFPHQTFQKVGLRSALAVAVVSFAGMFRLSPDGCVQEARFAWGSVAPTVVRLPGLEEKLAGAPLDRDTIRSAAALVREGVSPMDDIRGSADYRRSVAANLLVRFLEGIHA